MHVLTKIQIRIFNPKTLIFRFFTKIQTERIIDPDDPQRMSLSLDQIQNWILWIHDPKCFFTTDPKRVNIASGNLKQF